MPNNKNVDKTYEESTAEADDGTVTENGTVKETARKAKPAHRGTIPKGMVEVVSATDGWQVDNERVIKGDHVLIKTDEVGYLISVGRIIEPKANKGGVKLA